MKGYLNYTNYFPFLCHKANSYFLANIENLLSPSSALPLSYPPIFFLGAPRSGSTLAIQTITDCLDLGYISNSHANWYGFPGLAEFLFKPTAKRPSSDYTSHHGIARGGYAPSECGNWWYRFFRTHPSYVGLNDVDVKKMELFRKSISALTNSFDRPVIFKNLYASLRIIPITHFIPESLFIITHRDEIDNGHSLLEVRKKVFGNYKTWWSMKPPGHEKLDDLPPCKQVIEQIRHIQDLIKRDLKNAKVPKSRIFHISFDELCSNPNHLIKRFKGFLTRNGCQVKRIGYPPDNFKQRASINIEDNLFRKMRNYAKSN